MADPLLIAKGDNPLYLLPGMSNRHGLVAGATGTGKTVTLQVMAESFSRVGVPVFAADVKGDLSGISQPGSDNPKAAGPGKKVGTDRLQLQRLSGHLLGCLRRAGPSRPRHDFGDGPAAHQPHPEPERHPGGRDGAGLQDCRRQRSSAARPERSASHAAACRRFGQGFPDPIRQHLAGQHRHHSALL